MFIAGISHRVRHPLQRACVYASAYAMAAWGTFVVCAADTPEQRPVITNPGEVWALPPEAKNEPHRLRLEGRISYVDMDWGLFWLDIDGVGTYLQMSSTPPQLKTGQYVIIEGTIIPK